MKTLLAITFAALAMTACGHTQLVAATTSTGHNYQYCLEVTYPVYVATADALFCGGLDQVTAQKAALEKACPAKTYTIIPAK